MLHCRALLGGLKHCDVSDSWPGPLSVAKRAPGDRTQGPHSGHTDTLVTPRWLSCAVCTVDCCTLLPGAVWWARERKNCPLKVRRWVTVNCWPLHPPGSVGVGAHIGGTDIQLHCSLAALLGQTIRANHSMAWLPAPGCTTRGWGVQALRGNRATAGGIGDGELGPKATGKGQWHPRLPAWRVLLWAWSQDTSEYPPKWRSMSTGVPAAARQHLCASLQAQECCNAATCVSHCFGTVHTGTKLPKCCLMSSSKIELIWSVKLQFGSLYIKHLQAFLISFWSQWFITSSSSAADGPTEHKTTSDLLQLACWSTNSCSKVSSDSSVPLASETNTPGFVPVCIC